MPKALVIELSGEKPADTIAVYNRVMKYFGGVAHRIEVERIEKSNRRGIIVIFLEPDRIIAVNVDLPKKEVIVSIKDSADELTQDLWKALINRLCETWRGSVCKPFEEPNQQLKGV